jgi:hypothetical protein
MTKFEKLVNATIASLLKNYGNNTAISLAIANEMIEENLYYWNILSNNTHLKEDAAMRFEIWESVRFRLKVLHASAGEVYI